MFMEFSLETLKARVYLEDESIGRSVILQWILKK